MSTQMGVFPWSALSHSWGQSQIVVVVTHWLIVEFIFDRVNCYGGGSVQSAFGGYKMSGIGREM